MATSSPRIHQHWTVRDVAYRMLDASSILCAWILATQFHGLRQDEYHLVTGFASIVVLYLVGEITGLYRSWRGVSFERELGCTAISWCATFSGMTLVLFVADAQSAVRHEVLYTYWIVALAIIFAVRAAMRLIHKFLRRHGVNTQNYAIVGVNDLSFQLADNIDNDQSMGLRFCGLFDDRPEERTPDIPARFGDRVGTVEDLVQDAKHGRVHIVYITFPMRAEDRIRNVLNRFSDSTASVYLVPDFFVFELLHSRWTNIGGIPAVSIFENPFYGIDGMVKRGMDLVIASVLVALLAVPMAVIAIMVKATSPGPVFFRQKRYGLDGRQISVWKFRSMSVCENGTKVTQAQKNDPRVTPLGSFLRKSSLDELPQLFNVLEGTMSLVGPRPHANIHNEEYRSLIKGYMLRHKVKPGITGLAQVNGWRGETDTLEKMQKRIECDHQYIREWSVMMDFKILLRTVWVVFARQNAY